MENAPVVPEKATGRLAQAMGSDHLDPIAPEWIDRIVPLILSVPTDLVSLAAKNRADPVMEDGPVAPSDPTGPVFLVANYRAALKGRTVPMRELVRAVLAIDRTDPIAQEIVGPTMPIVPGTTGRVMATPSSTGVHNG
jgi:hypothetical protein